MTALLESTVTRFICSEEPPQQWFTCDACDGAGELPTNYGYKDAEPCGKCGGCGGWLGEMEHDQ